LRKHVGRTQAKERKETTEKEDIKKKKNSEKVREEILICLCG